MQRRLNSRANFWTHRLSSTTIRKAIICLTTIVLEVVATKTWFTTLRLKDQRHLTPKSTTKLPKTTSPRCRPWTQALELLAVDQSNLSIVTLVSRQSLIATSAREDRLSTVRRMPSCFKTITSSTRGPLTQLATLETNLLPSRALRRATFSSSERSRDRTIYCLGDATKNN